MRVRIMTGTPDNNERDDGTGAPPPFNVPPDDHSGPAADGKPLPGRKLQWAWGHVPGDEPARHPADKVFRKTELPGAAPPATRDEQKKQRKRMEKNLRDPAGEIPPRQFETEFREFLCSLGERQGRIRDEAFLHVEDFRQHIDALECRLKTIRHPAPGSLEVKG